MKKKNIGLVIMVLGVLGFIAQAANEVSILVDNYSFELPGTVKCKNWDGETTYPDVPGWTDGDVTASDSGVETPSVGGPSDGSWSAFLKSTDAAVYQVTSQIINAGQDYTLMVDGRATSGDVGANLQLTMELFYDVAGVQTTLLAQNVVVPDRVSPYPWATFSLTIDSANVPVEALGHYIGIKFDNPSTASNWIGIDNVRLTCTTGGASDPVPADGVTVNSGLLTQLNWTLNSELGIYKCDVYFGAEPNVLLMDKQVLNPAVESVDINDFANYSTPLANGQYFWRIDCYNDADHVAIEPNIVGQYWSFTATSVPIVVQETAPAFQAKFPDETAEFTVEFSSSTPITYTWYHSIDNSNSTSADDVVVGTDSGTLTLTNLTLADIGYYYCKATNPGEAKSDPVRLSIKYQYLHLALDGNVNDSSDNGLDGTLFGEPNYVAGIVNEPTGQALEFDGTTDYIQEPNAFADFLPGVTVSVWAKPSVVANWARFVDFANGSANDNIYLSRNGTTNNLSFSVFVGDTSAGIVTASSAITTNEWQMFVATMDEEHNVVLYKNGLPVQTGTIAQMPNLVTRTSNLIGKSNWETDSLYIGTMDDIQIWNYAKSADNVADMYSDVAGNFCRNAPAFDWDGTCKVDLGDFAMFVSRWLECGLYPDCP